MREPILGKVHLLIEGTTDDTDGTDSTDKIKRSGGKRMMGEEKPRPPCGRWNNADKKREGEPSLFIFRR